MLRTVVQFLFLVAALLVLGFFLTTYFEGWFVAALVWLAGGVFTTWVGGQSNFGWKISLILSLIITPFFAFFVIISLAEDSPDHAQYFKQDRKKAISIIRSIKIRKPTVPVTSAFAIAVLLFCCLIDELPYGYYTFVRLSVFVLGLISTIILMAEKKTIVGVFFTLIAVLYNPFLKIEIEKEVWQSLDLYIGFLFVGYVLLSTLSLKRASGLIKKVQTTH